MKRSHLILFVGGILVAAGMVISFYGSKLTTQDLAVAEGIVSTGSSLELTRQLDPVITDTAVFVVQTEDFEHDSLRARIFGPSGDLVADEKIKQKSTEVIFQIKEKGEYKLILENSGADVFSIIGITHMPQKSILALNVLGQSIIVSGFVGLAIALIYIIKNRKKSV